MALPTNRCTIIKSMDLESLSLLYRHHLWANARILDAAARLRAGQFSQPMEMLGPDASGVYRSLRCVLVHMLSAEWIWRSRIQLGVSPPHMLSEADYFTLDDLRTRWDVESEAMQVYLTGLDAAQLKQTISYTTTSGYLQTTPLWQILSHLLLHAMQHRSEAALVLTHFDSSPGDLDLILFLREN
jgi:uncharacterized damage-inducible protein DinB